MNRFTIYRDLMTDEQHWQKTFGVITCKLIRADAQHRGEYNIFLDLLSDPGIRKVVARKDWRLVFTGGTFDSLPEYIKNYQEYRGRLVPLARSASGVIQMANLVVFGHLFGIAFFNHMEDLYADSPQNLCLRRICNLYDTPLFEDSSSIQHILDRWKRGLDEPQTRFGYPGDAIRQYYGQTPTTAHPTEDAVLYKGDLTPARPRNRETLAVVSHDKQKMTMLNFCLAHLKRILCYRRVISTGTTGRFLADHFEVALRLLRGRIPREERQRWDWPVGERAESFVARKIQPLLSGPKGGDVQISAKIIDGTCHRVLFFQDPQSAHPHQFDIRLLEKAVQDPETAALIATSSRTAGAIV